MSSDNQEILFNPLIYQDAIVHYGASHQVGKAIEEFSELTTALCHHFYQGRNCMANVEEELADAEIMISQLRLIVRNGEVDKWKEIKLKRLAKNIN